MIVKLPFSEKCAPHLKELCRSVIASCFYHSGSTVFSALQSIRNLYATFLVFHDSLIFSVLPLDSNQNIAIFTLSSVTNLRNFHGISSFFNNLRNATI